MPAPLPSLDSLYVFEAAARLGSFKAAAAELAVTATAVSHRIRALEDALGVLLFVRGARAVSLTHEGRILFEAAGSGLATIAGAVNLLCNPKRTAVTVSVTPELAAKWLVPRLADFQTACPHIDLHVHASYETADLNAGAADLAVRYGGGGFAGVEALPLFRERFAPVAAPRLKNALPDDVRQWPLIHTDWYRSERHACDWRAWALAAGVAPGELQQGIHYSDGTHAVQAAVAGQGVALAGLALLDGELRSGWLEVVGGPVLQGQVYYVCTPSARPVREAVQTVKNWLAASAGGRL